MSEKNPEKNRPNEKQQKNPRAIVRRSNAMIRSKSNQTLLQRKLFAYAMTKLKITLDTKTNNKKLVAVVNIGELLKNLGSDNMMIYSRAKAISKDALQHTMILEDDPVRHSFVAINILDKVEYHNGNLTLTFNDELQKHTLDVREHYTNIYLDTLLHFGHTHSFRIYETLSTYKFMMKHVSKEEPFIREYDLAELKAEIGLVDITDKMKDDLNNGKTWAEVLDKYLGDNQPYKNYSNFKTRVLDVAKKEIAESKLADIQFDYEPIRQGKGGKTVGVRFFVWPKEPEEQQDDRISAEKIRSVLRTARGRLDEKQAETLLIRADGDAEKVNYYLSHASGNVKNLLSWTISAIENNWTFHDREEQKTKKTGRGKRTGFSNFEGRENNYDDIQKKLILKSMQEEKEEMNAGKRSEKEKYPGEDPAGENSFKGEKSAEEALLMAEENGQYSFIQKDDAEKTDPMVERPENNNQEAEGKADSAIRNQKNSISGIDSIQDPAVRKKIQSLMDVLNVPEEDPIIQEAIARFGQK